jgi:two-component system LytT family sensor kinase
MIRFSTRYRWHFLFWLLYLIGWTAFSAGVYKMPLGIAIGVTFIYMLGQGILIYLTAYRWVPRYMVPRRIWWLLVWELLGLSLSALFISGGMTLLLSVLHKPTGVGLWPLFGYTMLGNTYWIILVLVFLIIRDKWKAQRQAQELERTNTQTELRFLKSQMNPHFLFNALNSIYVLIRKDPERAAQTLARFSDMLRYQLYDCATDHISIEKELEYLDNYIRLEQIRKGNTLQLEYVCSENMKHFSIAPLLIAPLVENAFKYVSSHTDRENKVSIRITHQDSVFQLSVNNTVGSQASWENTDAHGRHSGGIGLANLQRRLDLLYANRHRLHIESTEKDYTATLTLHLKNEPTLPDR